jgi:rhamnogalacturonyl hydrolase YesR
MRIKSDISFAQLMPDIERMWELSGKKIDSIRSSYDHSQGAPVFTVEGKYTTRGWTEWTQGFEYGSSILQFDATEERGFLDYAVEKTVSDMAPHVTHFGVHDHGFNNVSTYGNLLRLMNEGLVEESRWQRHFLELALKMSGAVQARRWTELPEGGFVYSFNGPHSLFADTIRSLRILAVSHQLGHFMYDENDRKVSLLVRLIQHAEATAKHIVYYGENRDAYDFAGRVVHEAIFNTTDGNFRCPSSQQGFSPFTTWTRGLAWIMCGYAEELEFLASLSDNDFDSAEARKQVEDMMLRAARVTCDFYIENTAEDGIPYWDTGAPQIHKLGNYRERESNPFNDHEPVDSSAAAIACQGLLRLGHYLGETDEGRKYTQAGLTVLGALLQEPYISNDEDHQGLLLHSVYHRPKGWDHVPPGRKVPCGESSMWGDYHLREAALYVQRIAEEKPYLKFFL